MERTDFQTFCADPQLIGEPISQPWLVFYAAMDGLPLDDEGIEIFRACTGRDRYEPRVYTECMGVCGRRSEKTSTGLKYLLWKSLFSPWAQQLRKSWFARIRRHSTLLRVPLIAQDMRVARDIQRTLESFLLGSPVLAQEVAEVLATEIILTNGIAFTCIPASKASTRSMSVPGCLLDELAFVSIEGASDVELVRSVKPSMIQFGPERRLLKLSTPWTADSLVVRELQRRAELPDILVWQGSTSYMSPRISREELAKEQAADAIFHMREYEAIPTSDLEQFLPEVDIRAAIKSWRELPPEPGEFCIAALDASGLSGGDTFVFGVVGGNRVKLLRGWRKGPAGAVLDEIAQLCRDYKVTNILCDQYSFTFLAELMRLRKIGLAQLNFSARTKPEVHFDLKNLLAAGGLELPNHPEMARQLRALESMRTSGGAYKIGAPHGQHDDYVTVLAILANKLKNSAAKPVPRLPEIINIFRPAGEYTSTDPANALDPFNSVGFAPRGPLRNGPSFGPHWRPR